MNFRVKILKLNDVIIGNVFLDGVIYEKSNLKMQTSIIIICMAAIYRGD